MPFPPPFSHSTTTTSSNIMFFDPSALRPPPGSSMLPPGVPGAYGTTGTGGLPLFAMGYAPPGPNQHQQQQLNNNSNTSAVVVGGVIEQSSRPGEGGSRGVLEGGSNVRTNLPQTTIMLKNLPQDVQPMQVLDLLHSFRVWFNIFSTRFECSFHIFSTLFECSFHIFFTRFECSLTYSPLVSSVV